ncbi:MAG: hypothetical protein LBT55_03655 [Clostridiaceae bacterium]|jgi:acetyltransferase-like isoleucine patch superfamily enzyme|nr:hypothetical protein [Clostridiaceae bacterium]
MMNNFICAKDALIGERANIGAFSIIGRNTEVSGVRIGNEFIMGAFSKIEDEVVIGNNCRVGDYCGIYYKTEIGNNVTIEHGSKVFARCKIGNDVVINASVSQRVIMEDGVRFFGRIAHSHRNHTLDWKNTVEESPMFKKGCFIGINALIIGNITIGENAYIGAGEIVRCNIPADSVFYKGKIYDKRFFKGLIV